MLHIYQSLGREIFDDFLLKTLEYTVKEHLKVLTFNLNISEDRMKAIIKFTKCTLIGVCIDWIKGGMKEDYIDDFHRISKFSKDIIKVFICEHKAC